MIASDRLGIAAHEAVVRICTDDEAHRTNLPRGPAAIVWQKFRRQLATSAYVELRVRVREVALHRAFGDEELSCDLGIRAAAGGELGHAPFAWRERLEAGEQ